MAMKKHIYTFLAFAPVLILSCQKEDNSSVNENDGKETLTAVVEDGLKTKGDYEISGSSATFSWTSDDEFCRFVRADNGDGTYGNYNHYTYLYSSGSGNSVEFSGDSVGDGYADTGFALYPTFKYRTNTGANFGYKSSSDLYFQFNGTIAFNSSNPLKNIVPMLGKLEGATYTFKPLVGVVAVTLTNIPEEANKVELSTTDKGMLNGNTSRFCDKTNELGDYYINYYLGPATHGLRKSWINGTSKTYTFDANSFTEATFYFPVATTYNSSDESDPYTNFTVTVKKDDDAIATISKSGISLTVERGEIVALPSINCNYFGTKVTTTLIGDPTNIKAYCSVAKGAVTHIRGTVLTSRSKDALDMAIPNNTSGVDLYAATTVETAVSMTGSLVDSGAYYIGVKAFNESTEVAANIYPVYYIKATDITNYIGTFDGGNLRYVPHFEGSKWCYIGYDYGSGNGITATDDDLVIALSDNLEKGNVMVTNILGLKNDGTASSGSFINNTTVDGHADISDATYAAGSPVYGVLSGTKITFDVPSSQNAFVTYNGSPVYFANGQNLSVVFNIASATDAGTTTVTLTSATQNLSLPITMSNYSKWQGCLIRFQGDNGANPRFTRSYTN